MKRKDMVRVITFVRRIAGLLEPSLESEFYEEFVQLSKYLDKLIVVSDIVDIDTREFEVYKAWTIRIPKIYGITKILSYCYSVFKLRKEIDVIYVRTFSPPETAALWLGRKFLRRKAILLLPSTWFFEPPSLKNRIYKWVLTKAVYIADKIILYTPLMLNEIKECFPRLSEDKIVYIHNAVNISRFTPGEPDEKILNKYLDASLNNKKILLYVGRLSRRKGILDLVKAFKMIYENEPDAILVLAGGEEKQYMKKVRELIKELKLDKSILFLGPVPNEEVVHLMRACKVFVYSSIGGEGIPRAILEAMACGKPVVATRVTGIPQAVRDNETGFTVDVGDTSSFADKVIKLLKDDVLREKLGIGARRLIEKEFTYSKIIPQLAKILNEVVQ